MIEGGESSQVIGERATVEWAETLNTTTLLLAVLTPLNIRWRTIGHNRVNSEHSRVSINTSRTGLTGFRHTYLNVGFFKSRIATLAQLER